MSDQTLIFSLHFRFALAVDRFQAWSDPLLLVDGSQQQPERCRICEEAERVNVAFLVPRSCW